MSLRSGKFSSLIVRYVLEQTHATRAQVAAWAECDPSYLTKVVKGACGLTTESLQKLAEKAGIPLPRLVIEAQLMDESLSEEYRRFVEHARDVLDECWMEKCADDDSRAGAGGLASSPNA